MLPVAIRSEANQLAEQIAVLMTSVNNPDSVLAYIILGAIIRNAQIDEIARDTFDVWG